MKSQLYIGDDLACETAEVVAPPRVGDLIIYKGQRLRVRTIGHDIDKKKLHITCHVPPPKAVEPEPEPATEQFVPDDVDTDLEDSE